MSGYEFSEETDEAIDQCAEDLFALLSSFFERDFEALGYQCRLHLPVSPDARVFYDDPRDMHIGKLADSKLDCTKDWVAEVGYLPKKSKLGFTRLELPLKTPSQNEWLVFQRVRGDYFWPLHGNKDAELKPFEVDGTMHPISSLFVTTMLARAGYGLPELFTSPDDLRLHMSELTAASSKWAAQETVVIPEDPFSQTTITRTSSQRFNGTRDEIDITLTSVSEMISMDKTRRKQISISFNGCDYSMEPPSILVQELHQTYAIPAVPGSETYVIAKEKELQVTAKQLGALTAMMVDTLIGV